VAVPALLPVACRDQSNWSLGLAFALALACLLAVQKARLQPFAVFLLGGGFYACSLAVSVYLKR
jgi:hypothetical protein